MSNSKINKCFCEIDVKVFYSAPSCCLHLWFYEFTSAVRGIIKKLVNDISLVAKRFQLNFDEFLSTDDLFSKRNDISVITRFVFISAKRFFLFSELLTIFLEITYTHSSISIV